MHYVICYDITDDRRRRRVAKLLKGYGWRLHESTFQCQLRPAQYGKLQRRLSPLLNARQDRLIVYPLCQRDHPDRLILAPLTQAEPPWQLMTAVIV